jgi:hypothetical protein
MSRKGYRRWGRPRLRLSFPISTATWSNSMISGGIRHQRYAPWRCPWTSREKSRPPSPRERPPSGNWWGDLRLSPTSGSLRHTIRAMAPDDAFPAAVAARPALDPGPPGGGPRPQSVAAIALTLWTRAALRLPLVISSCTTFPMASRSASDPAGSRTAPPSSGGSTPFPSRTTTSGYRWPRRSTVTWDGAG